MKTSHQEEQMKTRKEYLDYMQLIQSQIKGMKKDVASCQKFQGSFSERLAEAEKTVKEHARSTSSIVTDVQQKSQTLEAHIQ